LPRGKIPAGAKKDRIIDKSCSSQKFYSDKQYFCFRKHTLQLCLWQWLNQNWSGFATKLQSVKQFLKSKSTFENNIYHTVAFSQALLNPFEDRGLV